MKATIKIEFEFESADDAVRVVKALPGFTGSGSMNEAQVFALSYNERARLAEEEGQRMFDEIQALTNAKRAKKQGMS